MLGLSNPDLGVLMLGLFIVFILFGFPIGFTLMAMGVGFGFLAMGDRIFILLAQKTFQVMSSDVLISVPLFVFMGYIIERANILDRLFRSIQLAAGPLPASLALATLLTCALFATATGIVGAVVTLMGLLAYPAMLRAGYDEKLSAGVVCAGGCLGILIPPSVMLILYGAVAAESVPRLYAGAFLPGLMLAGLYMAYVIVRALLRPELAPVLPKDQREPLGIRSVNDALYPAITGVVMFGVLAVILWASDVPASYLPYVAIVIAVGTLFGMLLGWKVAKALMTSFVPLALLILAVLGAIFFGWSTPSEGAALGALGAIVLALAYRALTFEKLKDSVFLTARTSAMVCWLFVGSFIYSAVFAYLGGQAVVEEFVRGLAADVHDRGAGHHLSVGLAARVDRDHRDLRADLPAAPEALQHRSGVLRHHDRAEHPDLVPLPAGGDGAVLSQRGGAAAYQHQRDLRRRHAVHVHRADRDGAALRLPRNRHVAAARALWKVRRRPRHRRRSPARRLPRETSRRAFRMGRAPYAHARDVSSN
jgi:TRAP-type mannitol/chloroaromatic compound transport system permease large subunit